MSRATLGALDPRRTLAPATLGPRRTLGPRATRRTWRARDPRA